MLADVNLSQTLVFPAGKTVHLNLMGHNLTSAGTTLLINGTTDIQDTKKTGIVESTNNVAVAVGNNAKVTVFSGTLKGREGAIITGTSTGATIEVRGQYAKLIATDNAVIAGNGSNRAGKSNKIDIKKGTFEGSIISEGYIACGIYAPWNDNVTVSGGTFNINNGVGILARAGNVKVTGGIFNCTGGDKTGWVGDNKNQIPCAALVFDSAANYPALTNDSKILVSGGTFSTDPSANGATLASGFSVVKSEDGTFSPTKTNPPAEVDGMGYPTLGAAINAAAGTDSVVKLLQDVNDDSAYWKIKDKVILDLNGHNITASGQNGVFEVTASGDLTIKGNGVITAVEKNKSAMVVWATSPNAKISLEGGTYRQQISNTSDPQFDMIYALRGTVYIKGGTFECATPAWTLNCKDEYYKSGEASIEVSGGTFKGFDPADNKAEGDGTNFMADGYCTVKSGSDSDATYTVAKAVAKVGDVGYASLQEAVDAANAGDTVTLLTDVEQNSELSIDKNITLNFGGKRLYNTKAIWHDKTGENDRNIVAMIQINGADVTLTGNGKVECMQDDCYAINVDGGSLIIENGEYIGNVSAVQVNTGSLAIKGGKFSQIQSGYGDKYLINCIDANYANGSAKVSITGGQFVRFDPSKSPEKAVEGKVPSYCAEGYSSFKNSDGTYGVAQKGEEVKPGKDSKNSGSVATSGVTVDQSEQKKVAESASKAANDVKNVAVETGATETKIGDVTVDTTNKAEEVNAVVDAAKKENATVSVQLVVKAAQAAAVSKNISQAVGEGSKVVPFELSVDMVTEVKAEDGTTTAATVPVKETAQPITVTIKVDPQSIAGKNVMVARDHGGVVELIKPSNVNDQTGEITFETAKFSDYAVVASEKNKSYKLEDYTDANGTRKTINNAEFNVGSDYAFAGWYKDVDLTQPRASTDVKGTVYPKFVKISDYIQYMGGSLRMDGPAASESTSLRFGYITSVPDGAKYIDSWWTWNDGTNDRKPVKADKRVLFENGKALANLVLTGVPSNSYSTTVHVTEHLKYQTVDGTTVEVAEASSHQHSVATVAQAIQDNPGASSSEQNYAKQILATIK